MSERKRPKIIEKETGPTATMGLLVRIATWSLFGLVLIISSYASFAQSNRLPANCFTGTASIVVVGTLVDLNLRPDVRALSLRFSENLEERRIRYVGNSVNAEIEIDKDWLNIRSADGILDNNIILKLAGLRQGLSIGRITAARVDGQQISIYELYTEYANFNPISTTLRYQYSLENVGSLLANGIGSYVPIIVIWLLLPIVVTQAFSLALHVLVSASKFDTGAMRERELDVLTEALAIPLAWISHSTPASLAVRP